MGWFGFGSGEESSGDTGEVSDVKVNVKTDKSGEVTHVMVNRSGGNPHKHHEHYYKHSSGTWGSKTKGKG